MASRRKKTTDEPRELATSGALCLAFANSGAPVPDARRLVPLVAVRFDRYADVVAWIRRMGAASAAEAERLLAAAAKEAAEAAAAAARARTLRGALVRIFTAESAGKRARAADLKTLNDALVPALAARRLVAAERGCGWTWEDGGGLDRALWPVALSCRGAADLRGRLARAPVRRPQVPAPLRRPRTLATAPVVRHARLRQPRQEPAALSAPPRQRPSPGLEVPESGRAQT